MIFIKFYVLFLVSLTSSAISPQLKSLTRIEPRIFGGKLVAAGQFPYLVSLRTNIYETVIHECGGAIISEKFILLAAHCINKNNPVNQYEVAVSAYNIKDGEVFKVKSFYQHEQFVSSILMNDIALAELVKPIKFTNTVQSIELNHNFIEDAMEGIVAGFDETDQTHELKYIHLTTITNDDCKKRYRNKKVPIHETKTLCAASNVPGTALCPGDSGGPFIALSERPTIIGVVSWGYRCGTTYPSGFTRISEYIEWINTTITMANIGP